jgi:hypothetical protein
MLQPKDLLKSRANIKKLSFGVLGGLRQRLNFGSLGSGER